MTQYGSLIRKMKHAFLTFPGMKPKAIKRNILVALFYLLTLGILFSLLYYLF